MKSASSQDVCLRFSSVRRFYLTIMLLFSTWYNVQVDKWYFQDICFVHCNIQSRYCLTFGSPVRSMASEDEIFLSPEKQAGDEMIMEWARVGFLCF